MIPARTLDGRRVAVEQTVPAAPERAAALKVEVAQQEQEKAEASDEQESATQGQEAQAETQKKVMIPARTLDGRRVAVEQTVPAAPEKGRSDAVVAARRLQEDAQAAEMEITRALASEPDPQVLFQIDNNF